MKENLKCSCGQSIDFLNSYFIDNDNFAICKNCYRKKEMKNKSIEKTWSIKHEGHLNPNNIIFRDKKYLELVKEMKKIDDKLGK